MSPAFKKWVLVRWCLSRFTDIEKPISQVWHQNIPFTLLGPTKHSSRKPIINSFCAKSLSFNLMIKFCQSSKGTSCTLLSLFYQNLGAFKILFQVLQTKRQFLKSSLFVKYPRTFSPMWGKLLKVIISSMIKLQNSNQTERKKNVDQYVVYWFALVPLQDLVLLKSLWFISYERSL